MKFITFLIILIFEKKLRYEYSDKLVENHIIFPSSGIHYSHVEPYNACLSLHQIIDSSDFVNVI